MNHYNLSDAHAHHWQDYNDQKRLLAEIRNWLWEQSPDTWIESLIFGLDDQDIPRWYATAYCAGKLPDGKLN